MILTCAEMKELETRAFADGISAEALMEQAGQKIALAVRQFFPRAGRCIVFFGKGHNGGDALVAARHLAQAGWEIELMPAFPATAWVDLTARKHHEFQAAQNARASDLPPLTAEQMNTLKRIYEEKIAPLVHQRW